MTIRERWNALSDRQWALLTYGLPLLGSGLLFAADWWWRQSEGVASASTARMLFMRVGVAFFAWSVIKLMFTRRWTLDGVGALWALLGTAGLFVRLFARVGPTPGERERDAIQAALDVGAAILLVSLVIWLLVRVFARTAKGETE